MASELTDERVQAVIAIVTNSPAPIGRAAVQKRAGAKGLDEALAEALRLGAIFEHPAARGKTFWREPWRPELRIAELCGKNALTLGELGKKMPKLGKVKLEEAVRGLMADGALAPLHKFAGNSVKRGSRFGTAELCRKTLAKAIGDLQGYYLGAGIRAEGAPAGRTDEEIVSGALGLLETREAVAVGFGELRESAGLPKARFDEAVLGLSRKGTVVLHEHDAPSLLTEERRNDLVADQEGRYYVGISWTDPR